MKKKGFFILFVFVCIISLNGCATSGSRGNLEAQGLRNQISILESQLQSKDEEINSLRQSLDETARRNDASSRSSNRIVPEVKSRPRGKEIQTALRNAGYSPGSIDGRIGRQTRDAIKAFQRANNLAVDGKVGQETWRLLKEYLYKKVK